MHFRLSPVSRLLAVASSCVLLPAGAQDWTPLFNGKNLDGWSGDPRLWRVEQGVLTGETDQAERKLAANTFLIWKGGEPEDFEVEFKARIGGDNNSGLQYRSKVLDAATWSVGGYQMDLHPAPQYLGMLYEERGRGIACESGQKVELTDKAKVTGQFPRPETKLAEWNDYKVIARGDVLQHFINGKQVSEIHDVDAARRSLKGVLALQLHAGPSMKAEFKDLRMRAVKGGAKPTAAAAPKAAEPLAKWIWLSPNASDGQKAFFRREFELPQDIVSASVTVSGDNWQRTWVNGKDLGWTSEWSVPANHDVGQLVHPGAGNVIAVEGRNQEGIAAVAVRLSVTLKSGRKIYLVSDDQWLSSPEGGRGWQEERFTAKDWKPAVVIAKMGDAPWGRIFEPESSGSGEPEDMTAELKVVDGFRVERLYKVPGVQGSWVSMTVDGTGKLLCADQYGKIYKVVPAAGPNDKTTVTPTAIPLSGAHGLLWHEGVLYVTVNEGNDRAGVYRITDSDRDGEPDKPELLLPVNGRGEHGPHGLAVSPDRKWLYFVAGNFTDLPQMDSSLPPKVWQEDQLLPRRPDAKGHAHDRMAPGGWVARMNLADSKWQLFAMGFRNSYDIAFNWKGDLFTYDSDMEWDLGMPWYRPTRICHVVPGAEFGWRNGSGVWPEYYEDSMYSQLDMGPGSPTGVLSGRGAKFPEKYQRAIFALDWTYATIHAIHLTPDSSGPGYKATREDFLAGTGLPVTDAVIGKDGAMYFLTGGRRTASALWRVTYDGSEPVKPLAYEQKPLDLRAPQGAWENLGSPDRLTRYESRLAVETAGAAMIARELAGEKDPWRVIEGSIALARTGTSGERKAELDALNGLDWAKLDKQQRLNWLRATGLVFARHGQPSDTERAAVLAKIDAAFPSNDADLDRELCRMLSYLQAPGIVGRTLALMSTTGPAPAPDWLETAKRNANYGGTVERMVANLPPAQIIHYIYCLRVVKGPWTEDERKRFFGWFDSLLRKSGGESYAGFIKDLRNQTLATCTSAERTWVEKLGAPERPNPLADLPRVTGPGREWTVTEIEKLAASGLSGRSKENGKKMYQASLCAACHRFDGEGGSAGPDLTMVGGRFSVRDLAEAILEPSKVVSDQYAFDVITKRDGSQVIGKLVEEKDEHWIVATSPFDFTATMEIERSEIKDIKPSPISPMPAALVNRLNPDELKDLLAYLLGK